MNNEYFQAIKKDETTLPKVLEYFNDEYEDARKEVDIKGSLTECVSKISSRYEYRVSQLQEIEAILKHFEIKLSQRKSSLYQKFLENYNRSLSSTDIKIYIEGQPEVVAIQQIINEIALIRNKYMGLTKGFETANYQLSNLSRLYASGVDGVQI
jgi:hypothetical protein